MTKNSSTDDSDRMDLQITDASLEDPCPEGMDRYEDVKPFAEGGGAEIHLGRDKTLKRNVIIKTLRPKFRDDERMRRRFLREARVTAMIQHPGSVPVYEMGRNANGDVYFTMKKVEGYSLKQVIAGRVAKTPDFDRFRDRAYLVDIIIRAGETVSAAHRHGVIHRDLKPENIQVGYFGEVVVMDWGVARILDEEEEEQGANEVAEEIVLDDLTQHGKLFGTPRYMSPEQTWASDDIDERSDVFSLGVVLYELICLRPLVIGGDAHALISKIRNEPFTPVRLKEPLQMVPHALDAICMKALRKKPEDRYQTMDEFIEDLRRFLKGETVEALPGSISDRMMRFRKNNPRLSAAIEFSAAGLLVGFILGRVL